jgi:hypothetical protein
MRSVVRELNDFSGLTPSRIILDDYFEAQINMPVYFRKDIDAFAINQDAESPKYDGDVNAARAFSVSHGTQFLDQPYTPIKKTNIKWPWRK